MANKKITELTEETSPVGADLLPLVDDVAGTPTTKKVTVTNLMTLAPVQTADISGFATQVSLGNHASLTSSVHGISAFGATLVDDADAATARTTLGLGTAATSASTDFSPAFYSTVTESTTARTVSDSDNGKVIVCTSSSDVTITLPNTLTAGFGCTVIQSGTGQVTIAAGAGSTLSSYAGTSTKGRYATLQIIPIGTNAYIVDGEGLFPPGAFESNIYAVSLDGTDDYAKTSNSFESILQSDFSISLWCKMANESGTQFLLGVSNSIGSNRLQIWHDGTKINTFLSAGGTTSATINSTATPNYTNWFHMVVTYAQNGSNVDNAIYVSEAGSTYSNTGTKTSMSLSNYSSTAQVGIGAKVTNTSPSLYTEGTFDEVAFFNYKLTSSQVTNIYKGETDGGSGGTSGVPGSLTTFNPQHWWRMGDNDSATGGGTPSSVTDKGGAATTYDLSFPNGATSYDLSTTPDSIYVAP
jgi:hypothetical protein